MASTQEEHEGTREVPKPSRAVRRRSTEDNPGRSGIPELVLGSHGWLVAPERGRCEILSGSGCAGQVLGVVVVSEHHGEMFVTCPHKTELVFFGFLSVPPPSLGLFAVVQLRALVIAHLSVRSGFLSTKAGLFLSSSLSSDVLWVLLLLL